MRKAKGKTQDLDNYRGCNIQQAKCVMPGSSFTLGNGLVSEELDQVRREPTIRVMQTTKNSRCSDKKTREN